MHPFKYNLRCLFAFVLQLEPKAFDMLLDNDLSWFGLHESRRCSHHLNVVKENRGLVDHIVNGHQVVRGVEQASSDERIKSDWGFFLLSDIQFLGQFE